MVAALRRLTGLAVVVVVGAVTGCGGAKAPLRSAAGGQRAPSGDVKSIALSLESNPKLDRSQVRLTALERSGRARLDGRIADLTLRARESGFAELDVLVELSASQIERGSLRDHPDADRDLADAEGNLVRVLAIDEHAPSAWNQLALVHLAKAKRLGRKELELAMGVCLQATREHPTYAPLRNTMGLVEFEIHDGEAAVRDFEAAVGLDASYADAQTNLAASLLAARRFEAAERAYDRALSLSADDYEAHLGRALARGGQIRSPAAGTKIDSAAAEFRARLAGVESDLERCKELDPERPEAYYNDAIVTERFKAVAAPTAEATSVLARARNLFDTFIAKAGERPEYAREVQLAKQRVRDLSSSDRVAKRPGD